MAEKYRYEFKVWLVDGKGKKLESIFDPIWRSSSEETGENLFQEILDLAQKHFQSMLDIERFRGKIMAGKAIEIRGRRFSNLPDNAESRKFAFDPSETIR